MFVWMGPTSLNYANLTGSDLNSERTANSIRLAGKSNVQFSDHLGQVIEMKPKDLRLVYTHRKWKRFMDQKTGLDRKLSS